jgi:hypothetical protein
MQETPNVKYKSRDTKVVIRNRQSKDRQHNGQTKSSIERQTTQWPNKNKSNGQQKYYKENYRLITRRPLKHGWTLALWKGK